MVPADDQAMALPCTSVIVIMVLLNVAFTCATPEAMFLRSRRRTRVASLPILNPYPGSAPAVSGAVSFSPTSACRKPARDDGQRLFLLAGNRFRRTLAGARVGVGALPAHRQAATMPQPAIAAQIHQPLDVHGHFASQVAFHDVVAVDDFAKLGHFVIGELRYPARVRKRHLLHDLLGLGWADAMDVLQRDHHALVGRCVAPRDASHCQLLPATAGRTAKPIVRRGGWPLSFPCVVT